RRADAAGDTRVAASRRAGYPHVEDCGSADIPNLIDAAILDAARTDRKGVKACDRLPLPAVQSPFEMLVARKRRRELNDVHRVLDLESLDDDPQGGERDRGRYPVVPDGIVPR